MVVIVIIPTTWENLGNFAARTGTKDPKKMKINNPFIFQCFQAEANPASIHAVDIAEIQFQIPEKISVVSPIASRNIW